LSTADETGAKHSPIVQILHLPIVWPRALHGIKLSNLFWLYYIFALGMKFDLPLAENQKKGGSTMKVKKLAIAALVVICSISFSGEVFARGGGGAGGGKGAGMRLQKRDGSCLQNSTTTQVRTRAQSQQQSQTGSRLNSGSTRRGAGQGARRTLGPGDGTGNTTRPMDGTGYGSPAK
jgi:hypothetical protein